MDNNKKICNNCKKEIKEKKTRKRKDSEENKFDCTNCDEFFTKKSEFKKHVKNCYDKFNCPSCNDSFDILSNLLMLKNHYIDCVENNNNKGLAKSLGHPLITFSFFLLLKY